MQRGPLGFLKSPNNLLLSFFGIQLLPLFKFFFSFSKSNSNSNTGLFFFSPILLLSVSELASAQ